MSANLLPVFTQAGLNAIAAAGGLAVTITHVAIGDGAYAIRDVNGVPLSGARAMTALVSERARVTVAVGGPLSSTQILLKSTIAAGTPEFWVREIGFFTSTGVLLAVWSSPTDVLGWRGALTPWLFDFTLAWADLPPDAITVQVSDGTVSAYSLKTDQLDAKVRHTTEFAELIYAISDPVQLTKALLAIMDNRYDLFTAQMASALGATGPHEIFVPATAMWPRGTAWAGAASPLQSVDLNNNQTIKYLAFDATINEFAQFCVALPKSWDQGQLQARFYWSQGSGGSGSNVVWGIAAACNILGASIGGLAFPAQSEVTATGSGANVLRISNWTSPFTPGNANDALTQFQINRNAAAGADDLSIDAWLLGVSLRYVATSSTDA